MMIAGAAEIIAGLIVAFVPRIGAWIVPIWPWLIIINLLLAAGFYDNVLPTLGCRSAQLLWLCSAPVLVIGGPAATSSIRVPVSLFVINLRSPFL